MSMCFDPITQGANHVIREAMRDWSAKWQQRSGDIEKLREMWADGGGERGGL
jgi:Arc/MetJ-type ribon-helix-helix transcriptional regulator